MVSKWFVGVILFLDEWGTNVLIYFLYGTKFPPKVGCNFWGEFCLLMGINVFS